MTDEEVIALYEAEIMNDPDAYTRVGECVYQITRMELLAAARAIEQAACAAPADQEPEAFLWYESGSGKPRLAHKTDTIETNTMRRATKLYAQPPQNAADHIEAQSVRDAALDTERLDYLDKRNARKNESHGTVYGWQLNENHNRIALEDHGFPALKVREAIDRAMREDPL